VSFCVCPPGGLVRGCPEHAPSETATLESIHFMLIRILENEEKIMATQAEIDAAVTQINATMTDVQAQVTQMGTDVTAIQTAISAIPASFDTTALDTAVASLAQTQATLDTAVGTVTALVPPAAAPPAA
jgi:phage-related protein